MAELATASGIAALIGLTIQVLGISYEYVNAVGNASSSVHRFMKELEDLQEVLHRVEQVSKESDEVDVFGDTGPCLLSIKETNEYTDLLHKVRKKLEQRQTGSSMRDRIKSLTWPFSEKETSALADSLHRHLEIYNTAFGVDNLTVGKLTLNEVRQLNASQTESMNQEILDWLSPLNMYQKQQDTLSRRHGTTGSWLLNDATFRDWIDSDDSQRTLWCPGDPGTGKTVITSIVVDYLTNNYAGEDTKIVYLYCDYKDQAVQTAANLIACLVRQVIGYPKVLPQQLEEMHKELQHQKRRPSFDELRKLLIALCKEYDRVYVIVDALDECEAIRERRLLLPVLEVLPDTSGRLFVTSRPNNEDISNTFGKQSRITIAAVEMDLRQYVAERIAEEERRTLATKFEPKLKDRIISDVSAGASGMFLLAALQMDRVFATRTVKGIKIALASMPQKMDELYRLTLERIQKSAGDDGLLAMRILSWITHARRLLSVNELRHGLAVEYDDDEENNLDASELDTDNLLQPESLVDVCAGLVIIDSTSQIIRLVHYTTQEYFSKRRLNLFAQAEVDISRACLTYLSYDLYHGRSIERIATTKAFQSRPFLDYASGHWFSHANSILSAENPAPVFSNFVARFKRSDSCLRSISLLHWDLQYGMDLYAQPPYPDKKCPNRESALDYASNLGLEELVTVLLDHSTGSFPGADRSLFCASKSGALNVVNLLLRHGAQVNFIVDGAAPDADTALGTACEHGHLPVVKVLLENEASPYIGRSPAMHAAAEENELIIVKFLLKEGVNVNARDSRKQTALHCAAYYASVDVIQLLLDAHCDLNLKDNNGCTALHYMAQKGDVDKVKLVLNAGCDLDLKDNNEWTPLHYATMFHNVDVVKLLLDAHCDPDLQDRNGRTAIQLAVSRRRVSTVKKLLDAHCDLNLKDNDGWTALHYAARNGDVDVVKLLLDAHCDLDLKDIYGKLALHCAASEGHVDVVKLLLDAHCDRDLKDGQWRTALHWAAYYQAVDVIELLLDRAADASAKDRSGYTARDLLKDNLSYKTFAPGGIFYKPGNREKAEGLVQRLIQLEQSTSTTSAGGV